MLQRIPTGFHMDTEVSVTCSEQPKEVQRIFLQDLHGLYPQPLQCTTGPEWPALRELLGLSLDRIHLWGDVSTTSILGPLHSITPWSLGFILKC